MREVMLSVLGGSAGAAVVTGLFALLQYLIKRKDEKSDKHDAERKALRYVKIW